MRQQRDKQVVRDNDTESLPNVRMRERVWLCEKRRDKVQTSTL